MATTPIAQALLGEQQQLSAYRHLKQSTRAISQFQIRTLAVATDMKSVYIPCQYPVKQINQDGEMDIETPLL